MDFKVEREREREREREKSQFNTAGGSEFQVRGAAVLNDRPANDYLLVHKKKKQYFLFIATRACDPTRLHF